MYKISNAIFILLMIPAVTFGETVWTAGSSGAYTTAGLWSAGVPSADNTDARILSGDNTFTGQTNLKDGVHLQLLGGTLTSPAFYVGPTFGQSGTFTVAEGATFSTGGSSFFGYQGVGVYNLNGTHLQTARNIWIGDQNVGGKSTGTLNLAGTLRLCDATGYIVCGNNGDGVVNQTAGLAVLPYLQIGIESGTGKYLHSGGTMLFAAANLSTVTPSAAQEGKVNFVGGKMEIKGNGLFASTSEMVIDSGTVTIYGGGSMVLDSTLPASDPERVAIGQDGTGTLTVNGGTLTSGVLVYVGENSGAAGTVNLNGGTLDLNAGLRMGQNAGSTGIVNIHSGTFDATGASNFVGYNGNAAMTVSAGGEYKVGGNNLWIANQGGTSTVTVDGGTLTSTGTINISDRAASDGTFTVQNGGTATAGTLTASAGKTTVNVSGGSFTVSGITTLGNASTSTANLNLTGTGTFTTQSLTINYGTLTLADSAVLNVTGTLSKGGNGTLTLTGGVLNAGTISFPVAISAGTLAPGGLDAIGTTNISGNLTLSGTARAVLDVDAQAGTTDQLTLSGDLTASESAAIFVNLLHPESLRPGQSYTPVNSGGTLSPEIFKLSEEVQYYFQTPDFANGNLVLSVDNNAVPEPAAWLLLALGGFVYCTIKALAGGACSPLFALAGGACSPLFALAGGACSPLFALAGGACSPLFALAGGACSPLCSR